MWPDRLDWPDWPLPQFLLASLTASVFLDRRPSCWLCLRVGTIGMAGPSIHIQRGRGIRAFETYPEGLGWARDSAGWDLLQLRPRRGCAPPCAPVHLALGGRPAQSQSLCKPGSEGVREGGRACTTPASDPARKDERRKKK